MSRLAIIFLGSSLLAVGCASKNPDPQAGMAPPPGWYAVPPQQGAVVAPAPSGCSSCAASQPVVNAPRYTPPVPAAPPLTSSVTVIPPTTGVALSSPVSPAPNLGPIQAAFKPIIPPIDSARLGAIQIEESTEIPVPPSDKSEAQMTSSPTKS